MKKNPPEDNHIGLILYGMGNGVSFELPGSEKEQLLRLYVGSWASEVTVTVSVNGTAAYEETFGKKELEAAILTGIQAVYAASAKQEVEMALVQAKAVIDKILADAGQEGKRVSGISLNQKKLTLDRGEKYVLQAIVTPSTAENKVVLYKSSDSQVAKVSADGTVKAQREGTAVITATTAEGQKIANCEVAVCYRGKWIKKKRGYRFKLRNGKYLKKSWKMVGRKFAYMDKKGYLLL
ncbi:MAG: Ig-like domain-containing protein [Lachnospiraceae bacterium]|nr:Ig-like domain-containing protein [Lachnospiraceae bacterium]